jgi:hypothetical protein
VGGAEDKSREKDGATNWEIGEEGSKEESAEGELFGEADEGSVDGERGQRLGRRKSARHGECEHHRDDERWGEGGTPGRRAHEAEGAAIVADRRHGEEEECGGRDGEDDPTACERIKAARPTGLEEAAADRHRDPGEQEEARNDARGATGAFRHARKKGILRAAVNAWVTT